MLDVMGKLKMQNSKLKNYKSKVKNMKKLIKKTRELNVLFEDRYAAYLELGKELESSASAEKVESE